MPPLPVVRGIVFVRALERAGFSVMRVRGSHYIMKHPDGRGVTVPVHGSRDLLRSTLAGILREIGMTVEELIKIL